MIDSNQVFLAVLAAGASARFGSTDKLAAPLHGKMLGLHITDSLSAMSWGWQAVICSERFTKCADGWRQSGYVLIENPHAHLGMGHSVALAAKRAKAAQAKALIIVLADMPFITIEHVQGIFQAVNSDIGSALIASTDGAKNSPPALFGAEHFDALMQLEGDIGARALLRKAHSVDAKAELLVDIDTPQTLAACNEAAQHKL